ncbi:nucleoside hydrolase [Hortaea werneckii]|nr:nucleoside hydrolase [Hortaea werneckii]KAI6941568.1 nucleoside hydrolase [Hortaea werneckii]KAI6951247.1 nucleoside hydrolase [Hortaea werneckii]KAI7026821.1 nucleoside hydrolase [Hortaea werneckii]KAI7027058.1 nucleoside hydrolase [Hortaea werneckii]
MARIFITGSSDGIGQAAAKLLSEQGHKVTLHARNQDRASQAQKAVPGAEGVLIGDISTIAGSRELADRANKAGPWDTVVHNAGLGPSNSDMKTADGFQSTFAVNSLAPYVLTALMEKPKRLLYVSSGLHQGGDDRLEDVTWTQRPFAAFQAYNDSKLHNVMLANAVARKFPTVQSCSLDPGWVQTKLGGGGAPGTVDPPAKAIAAFASGSEDPAGGKSGLYLGVGGPKGPHQGALDTSKQDELIMSFLARSFAALAAVNTLVSTVASPVSMTNGSSTNATAYRPKVILDNDWETTGFISYLQALSAGWEVLGLASDTANSWALQTGLHALATLEAGNLSCIPVYLGSDYPLINTPKLFRAWEDVHGVLPWEGAFAPMNLTAEEAGSDPTSGDPKRVSRAAFYEGFPNVTAQDISAAEFMVQSVRKYPGEVSIYSAGALTNIALAIRMDPSFASNAKELVIMGGYIDVNLLQTTGSVLLADLQSDINLMIDPEASKIAVKADFPNITFAGNVANQVMATRSFLDELYEVKNVYTELAYTRYNTDFPFWDETAAALMVDPSLALNTTSFYVDVDTAYGSPSYGNIHAYQEALAPTAQELRKVNYVLEIDGEGLKEQIKKAVQQPPACADLQWI